MTDETINTTESTEQANDSLIFGKFKSIDEAEKGYNSATTKLQEQGATINSLKASLPTPVADDYFEKDKWDRTVKSWKESNVIPKEINLDINDPIVSNLAAGLKKAKVSEGQVKEIFESAITAQLDTVAKARESVKESLGAEGIQKKERLLNFSNQLTESDKKIFDKYVQDPFLSKEEVDFFERVILGDRMDNNINTKNVEPEKSFEDFKAEAFEYFDKYKYSTDPEKLKRCNQIINEFSERALKEE